MDLSRRCGLDLIAECGFHRWPLDYSLFIIRKYSIFVNHVDDIIIIGNSKKHVGDTKALMMQNLR